MEPTQNPPQDQTSGTQQTAVPVSDVAAKPNAEATEVRNQKSETSGEQVVNPVPNPAQSQPIVTESASTPTPAETALEKVEHVVVEKSKEYAPVVRDFSVKWGKKGWGFLKTNSKGWFQKLDAKMDEIVEGMNKKGK